MTKFKNDPSPKVLQRSLDNREYEINWNSLKFFQFDGELEPAALIGKSIKGNMKVRIAFHPPRQKHNNECDRPFAVFYKMRNGTMHVNKVYYLSDEECDRFTSYFVAKH